MGPMKEHATVDCLSEHEHAVELNSKYYFYTQSSSGFILVQRSSFM